MSNLIPDNLIFISAAPHDAYFAWQYEVFITNCREHNVSDRIYILILYPKDKPCNDIWPKLMRKYPEVKFFLYQDDGSVNTDLYIPQLRPYMLKKHFAKFREQLKDKIFFYHDADIIFNYLPDFQALCSDNINWQSDTSSYLDYDYLKIKESQGKIPDHLVINELAKIGGITVDILQSYNKNSGGAQYILKGIDSEFWEDVERTCIEIRKYLFLDVNKKYFPSENHGFQSWCADMWAVNFCLWKRGKKTQTTELLDFSWATDSVETYNRKPIFHNAGATPKRKALFYKGDWIHKSPIGQKIVVESKYASSKYVEAIQKVKI